MNDQGCFPLGNCGTISVINNEEFAFPRHCTCLPHYKNGEE